MPKADKTTTSSVSKQKTDNRYVKIAGIAIVALLLFSSGWAFGRGNVSISSLRKGAVSTGSLDYTTVDELHEALVKNFDGTIEDSKALDGIKSGLARSSGDPYTEFFNEEDSKAFADQLNGSFEGIGAELGKEGTTIVIIAPIAGSPAEKAGVRARDAIVKIDDKDATDMSVAEAVKNIRGKAGTDVKLTLARDGEKVELTITRATITVPSVKWEVKDGIGIMTVSRFGDDTPALALEAANAFKEAKVSGVILDMRNNPGGLLSSAVDLSSLWLENGKTILLEKRGGKVQQTFKANGNPVLKGLKTAVLINEGSASASEITAGALHDNNVATLIGTTTYGKGSVQQVLELLGGGTLKVTVARWFTPNEQNIDKEGISPDKEVKLSEDDIKNKNDVQLQAAKDYLK